MKPIPVLLASAAVVAAHPSWGIAVDAQRRIYFSDVVRNEVCRLDTDGKVHTLARDVHSHDLELLPDGHLRGEHLWYDSRQEKFFSHGFRLSPSGEFTRLPEAVAPQRRDAQGNRYVSEPDRLLRITPSGQRQVLGGVPFAGEKRGKLARLNSLAVAPEGSVYVADIEYSCVRRVNPAGRVEVAHRSAPTWQPWGITLHEGELYVLEHRSLSVLPLTGSRILRVGRDQKTTVLHEIR